MAHHVQVVPTGCGGSRPGDAARTGMESEADMARSITDDTRSPSAYARPGGVRCW